MTLGKWLGLITIIGSVYIFWQLQTLVFLFLVAVVITTTLNRLVNDIGDRTSSKGTQFFSLTATPSLLGSVVFLIFFRSINQFDQLLELIPISVLSERSCKLFGIKMQSSIL